VSLGGAVDAQTTISVVQACRAAAPAAEVVAVLGRQTSDNAVEPDEPMVRYLARVEDMAALMLRVDMSVGAGGTTSWERCAVGLPSIVVAVANNQVPVGRALAENGCAVYLGQLESFEPRRLREEIRRLAADRDQRSAMSSASRNLVDGLGAIRVAHHLDGVRVRRATMADARLLWRWANDPDTRAASLSPDPIPYPDHVRWLRHRLADRSCLLLIGGNGAGPLGQVRFDSREAAAEVSISVAPEHRGTVGGLLLESAMRRFRRGSPRMNLIAQVKIDNGPSRRLFEHAGFRLVNERRGILRYHAFASVDADAWQKWPA
jgi:L-amino acid N-acyltransferase YncA